MVNDLTITSLETITAIGLDDTYMFTLDELQNATIANTQEKQDITGKQGRKLNSLKRNKAVTVSGTNGLVSTGLIAADLGADITEGEASVLYWETVTVKTQSATTTYKAVGTTGAEIISAYIKEANGLAGEELVQDAEAATGKFSYTPTTKTLAFHTDVEDGTEVVVYYRRKLATATIVTNNSGKYSKKCQLYVDAFAEDKCNNVYRVQFHIYTADFSGNFNFEMGDNQTVHSFEAEALASGCNSNGDFYDMIIFGEDTEDAA